nr:MAG TPA: hypothetical protein [Caudoviricetes sp.]
MNISIMSFTTINCTNNLITFFILNNSLFIFNCISILNIIFIFIFIIINSVLICYTETNVIFQIYIPNKNAFFIYLF